jgi:GT2 family glycosyltransferase
MKDNRPPKVSVVIPTCNRLDLLARCLDSLDSKLQGVTEGQYEVVVTDDAHAQPAEDLIKTKYPTVRWVQGPARGPAANRNCGAKASRGEWVAFIDDDCVASTDWIKSLLQVIETGTLDVIEGKTVIPEKIDNPFYHGVENLEGGSYWSCNLAFQRERFFSIGGFDEDFSYAVAEDMELAHRFTKSKFRAKFCPEALVYHPMRPGSFVNTFKRIFLVRWYVLYQYKTHEGLNHSKSMSMNFLGALHGETLNCLRRGWQEIKSFDFKSWRSSTFRCVFWVISTPIMLPYFLYWTCRYHQILNAKSSPSVS